MATRANVTIHLSTMGDIVLDQVVSCSENPNTYSEVRVVVMTGQQEVLVAPPGGSPVRYIQGLMIIPPPDNTYPYILKNTAGDTGLRLHPSNPSFLALNAGVPNIFLVSSEAPVNVTTDMKFIWV